MHPWSLQSLQAEFENPDGIALAAHDGASLVGYLFARESCESADILLIGVRSNATRQGIGKKLVGELRKQVEESVELFLEVSAQNQGAVRFYEAIGFKTFLVRRAYYPDGSDALCMRN